MNQESLGIEPAENQVNDGKTVVEGGVNKNRRSLYRRVGIILLKSLSGIALAIFSLWCFGVILYLFPWQSTFLAWLFGILILACAAGFFFAKFRLSSLMTAGALYVLVLILWFSIQPSNDMEWQTPWARMPTAQFNGDKVTVNNIRDFIYRSENDYEPHYITETFDLDKINDLRFITSFWDGNKLICHTMLDFGFKDGNRVVVSVETRLPKGKKQTSLGGLFKQYEVLAIFGTERDLLMLRTNFRKEDVYVYDTTSDSKDVRELFILLLNGINRLKKRPRFYNTLTTNCTTSLVPFIQTVRHKRGWSFKLILNGLLPEMAFKKGWFKLHPGESFAECKRRAYITPAMQNCKDRKLYSKELTEKLNQK